MMTGSFATARSLDEYPDLRSVPAYRPLRDNALVEHLRKAVSFQHVVIGGLDIDGYNFGYGYSIDTDLPPNFVMSYFGEKLGLTDPLVVAGRSRSTVISEAEAFERSPPSQRLLYLCRMHGVHNRIVIPLLRKGTVFGGVCFSNERPFTQGETDFLATMAEPLHRAVTKPLMDRFAAKTLKLTRGELHCLKLASEGKTSEEIAESGPYRTETVNSYLKLATRKLGSANRIQAVAEAIRRGLLD